MGSSHGTGQIPQKLGSTCDSQAMVSSIQKGSIVELVSGPFKGEKSKVVRLDESREEVVLELIEAAVPIPVTVKADQIRIIKKEAD